MSKKSEAKLAQGYIEKPLSACCSACEHYRSTLKERQGAFNRWIQETEIHCGIGGFKVKKTARCDRFKRNVSL